MENQTLKQSDNGNLFTLSEFRKELSLPLIVARKMVIWGEVKTVRALDGSLRITESELVRAKNLISNPWQRGRIFIKALGPGLITGASDDDPSGIGTYSSVGAKFGFAILWMAFWLLPIMLSVQEICARIGVVTNKGLAGVMGRHYNRKVVGIVVFLLIVANVVNIGADLGAMAASLSMLLPINFYVGAFLFTLITIICEVFLGYHIYVKFLKWLAISVLTYVIAGIIIHPDWLAISKNAFLPRIDFTNDYIFAMIAVFGTTITPYLFFWQTSEEVEEKRLAHKLCHGHEECNLRVRISKMRTDVGTGMILANVVFFFIVLTTAQMLFRNGITNIESAEQAAQALRPLAGNYAYLLFAIGIIGTGMLAVPVLAGSGAYALAEIMNWREGLELKFSRAKGFYLVIAVSIIIGFLFNLLQINPIKALYYSAYLNGIIALPLLVIIMAVGNDRNIMGEETHPFWIKVFGWMAVVFMALAVLASIVMQFV